MSRVKTIASILMAVSFAARIAHADVKLPAIFSDHMVLQQGVSVPVWGWADSGEAVTVTLAGQKQTATAGADKKWMLRLNNLASAAAPVEMTIAGKNSITVKDILIGEVWLGSGQSNMEFSVSKKAKSFAGVDNEDQEIAAANVPTLRMFTVKMKMTELPQDDCEGSWQVCTPETVGAFSAVGYFFSRDLQKSIKQPIGFINTSYGASCAQAWVSKDVLEADPRLKQNMDRFSADVATFKAAAANAPATAPATQGRGNRGGARSPFSNQHNPYVLWNAMIHPIQPYAIKGALWYQGESITEGINLYPVVMEHVITSWRKEWGQDFPFYFVQLAALDNNSNRPEVREAQAQALKVPKTGMAVTIDIGDKANVHPKNKQDLGDRLARIARANVYGEKIEFSGPAFQSMQADGKTIRVKFAHAAGLMSKDGDLKTFEIAGKDGNFVTATAKIDGETVIVSAPSIDQPTAVRYAWNRWPEGCNLYNSAGLPAAPFRSDDK